MTKANQTPGFPDALEVLCRQAPGVRLSFWWLACDDWSPRERFLYGYALPSRRQGTAAWLQFKEEKSFPVAAGTAKKHRLTQRSLDVAPAQARKVVEALRAGATLADGCSAAGVPAIDPDLGGLTLAPDWAHLPTVYLSTIPSQSFLSPHGAGRTGLVNGVGCYCARHTPPKRMAFLAGEVEPDLVVLWVAALLKRQTGVDFDGGGADAFGSFEVFGFPALDQHEKPLLSMATKRSDDGSVSALSLAVPAFGEGTEYIAQVRAEQVHSISFDQLVHFDHSGRAELVVPEPLDGILVRVWTRQADGPWILWDEAEWHYLRSFAGQLNLQGLSGTVTAPWLNRLPSKLSARARALQTISQVNMTVPMGVSTRRGWENDIMAARELVRRASPPKSEARFFDRGWGSNESKLEFAEWLKTILSSNAGTVLLTDPYFDVLGLDLISRASGIAKQLVVLTNTQVPSDDDEAGVGRAERLSKATEQYWPILSGLSLRLYDLTSSSGGKQQLFHDRYLLLYDDKDNIEKGFNLSTSLQSAATNTPLLVTPIPADVLDKVADYVEALMNPGSGGTTHLETLYPPRRVSPPSGGMTFTSERAAAVLRLLEVAGKLRSDGTEPAEQLRANGFHDGEKVIVQLDEAERQRVREYLFTTEMPAAAMVWDGLVEASLPGWRDGLPEGVLEVCDGANPAMESILVGYLVEHGCGRLRSESAMTHRRTLAQPLGSPFSQAMGEAARLYDHHHTLPIGTSWPIHVATLCLVHFFPTAVDKLTERLHTDRAGAHRVIADAAGPKASRPDAQALQAASALLMGSDAISSALVAALVHHAQWHSGLELPEAMKGSAVPLVRCLSAIAKLRDVQREESPATPATFLNHIQSYSVDEQQELLALAVYEQRIKSNRGPNPKPTEPLPDWLVSAVQSSLEAGASVERLTSLVALYSGPTFGARSISTHNEILDPLADRSVLSRQTVFEVWDSVLLVRLKDDHLGESDAELVQVWGYAFWESENARQAQEVTTVRQSVESASRALTAPLLRARDYKSWQKASRQILDSLFKLWAIARATTLATDIRSDVSELLAQVLQTVEQEGLDADEAGGRQELTRFIVKELRARPGET